MLHNVLVPAHNLHIHSIHTIHTLHKLFQIHNPVTCLPRFLLHAKGTNTE
jgi:hypothetical protein